MATIGLVGVFGEEHGIKIVNIVTRQPGVGWLWIIGKISMPSWGSAFRAKRAPQATPLQIREEGAASSAPTGGFETRPYKSVKRARHAAPLHFSEEALFIILYLLLFFNLRKSA